MAVPKQWTGGYLVPGISGLIWLALLGLVIWWRWPRPALAELLLATSILYTAYWLGSCYVHESRGSLFGDNMCSWQIPMILISLVVLVIANLRASSRREFPFCPSCGYNLTGNISGTCPECGNPVPESYHGRLVPREVVPSRFHSMDDNEVGRYWDDNAEAWTALSRAGYDQSRDTFNTPQFLAILPEVRGLAGLDIGCGEGHNTRLVARPGARMTAIDISAKFLDYARQSERDEPLGIEYLQASAQALPFADASFDFATAFMSLMDIPQPERAVRRHSAWSGREDSSSSPYATRASRRRAGNGPGTRPARRSASSAATTSSARTGGSRNGSSAPPPRN